MNKKIIGIMSVLAIVVVVIIIWRYNQGFKYEVAQVTQPQYFVVEQDGKYGVINKEGKLVVQSNYQEVQIPNPEKAVFLCYSQIGERAIILNENSEKIYDYYESIEAIPVEEEQGKSFETTRLLYKKDGKYGLLSMDGEVITKPIYDEIKNVGSIEGIFLVKQNELCGVINGKGTTIIKPKYETIQYDAGNKPGYIVSKKTEQGYRYGYLNANGKKIVETKYNELERIMQDKKKYYFIAFLDGQAGVLENKKEIIPHQYTNIVYYEEDGMFVVKRNEKQGLFDQKGKEILKAEYDNLNIVGEYVQAKVADNMEIYEKSGKKVEDSSYIGKILTENENYIIVVNREEKYGVIGKNNTEYIKNNYDYLEYIAKDYFIATRDGKTGVITKEDKSAVELKYSAITKIEGTKLLQATYKNEENITTEILDYNMKKIATLKDGIVEVKEGYIKLYSLENIFYISNEGSVKAAKEVLGELSMYASKNNGKWGFIDNAGNVKVDYQYEGVTQLNVCGYAGIYANGKWGVIDKTGTVILEPTYELKDTIEPDFIGSYYKKTDATGQMYYTK